MVVGVRVVEDTYSLRPLGTQSVVVYVDEKGILYFFPSYTQARKSSTHTSARPCALVPRVPLTRKICYLGRIKDHKCTSGKSVGTRG